MCTKDLKQFYYEQWIAAKDKANSGWTTIVVKPGIFLPGQCYQGRTADGKEALKQAQYWWSKYNELNVREAREYEANRPPPAPPCPSIKQMPSNPRAAEILDKALADHERGYGSYVFQDGKAMQALELMYGSEIRTWLKEYSRWWETHGDKR